MSDKVISNEQYVGDLKYNTSYFNLQKAVKSNDLMYVGIYTQELMNNGFVLPLNTLYTKYPQVKVFTSCQDTAQELIENNLEKILIYLIDTAKIEMLQDQKFNLFYIPQEDQKSNAYNTVRLIGSTKIYSTFLFQNWTKSKNLPNRLFSTLTNEIVCDWWGSPRPEIVRSAEYQQYTAAFTYFLRDLLNYYCNNIDSSNSKWTTNDYSKVILALNELMKTSTLNKIRMQELLEDVDFNYDDKKKLYLIDNTSYKQVRLEQLVNELQNMKNKFGLDAFDYYLFDSTRIKVRFNDAP